MTRRLSLTPLALAAALMLTPAAARAAQNTGTIAVSATVVASCQISAGPLAFGNYVGAQNDTTSTITVTCNTASVPYSVTMDNGLYYSGALSTRQMNNAGARLSYALYTDAARTSLWENLVSVAGTTTAASPSTDNTMVVYGRVPANQILTTLGLYGDTVTMTVTF
jgi:spore coat protein U-like protein